MRRPPPKLIVVTDSSLAAEDLLADRIGHVARLARPSTVMVQLRDKELGARQRLTWGARVRDLCTEHGHWFVVNDRVDLSMLLDADGVHLGESGVSTADARRVLPEHAWVSRACHEPLWATAVAADAVLLSPCFAPRKGRPALGQGALSLAVSAGHSLRVRPLLYALGGVDASNAALCLECGADGVAVIGAVLDGRDPSSMLRALGIHREA